MSQFLKTFTTEQGTRTFYFNLIQEKENATFHVSVVKKDNKVNMFFMELAVSDWKIGNRETEQWILTMEEQLSNAILEHTVVAIKGSL